MDKTCKAQPLTAALFSCALVLMLAGSCVPSSILNPLEEEAPAPPVIPPPELPDPVILIYACGDNLDAGAVASDVDAWLRFSFAPGDPTRLIILHDRGDSWSIYLREDGAWREGGPAERDAFASGFPDAAGGINLADPRNLEALLAMGETAAFSVLLLAGEGAAVVDGLIFDEGSNDYLEYAELAGALDRSPRPEGSEQLLLCADIGFSAGFELVYELAGCDSPPLFLGTPGPFPFEGRGCFSLEGVEDPMDFAAGLALSFLEDNRADPGLGQCLVNCASLNSLGNGLESLVTVLESLLAYEALEFPASGGTGIGPLRHAFMDGLLHAQPAWSTHPGQLVVGLDALALFCAGLEGQFDARLYPWLFPGLGLLADAASDLLETWNSHAEGGGMVSGASAPTLLAACLHGDASLDQTFLASYCRDQGNLAFFSDFSWAPDHIMQTGVLYRLWLAD